jgi:hypothetical protein
MFEGGLATASENQISYYKSLYRELIKWKRCHKLYWLYVLERIEGDDLMMLLGTTRRGVDKWSQRQREMFFKDFTEVERDLYKKYPHKDKLIIGELVERVCD